MAVVRPYATPTRSSGTVKGTEGQRTAAKALKDGGREGKRTVGEMVAARKRGREDRLPVSQALSDERHPGGSQRQ